MNPKLDVMKHEAEVLTRLGVVNHDVEVKQGGKNHCCGCQKKKIGNLEHINEV
jgi:hypothetical protein